MEGKLPQLGLMSKVMTNWPTSHMEAVDFGLSVGHYIACLRSGRLQDEKCSDATALPSKVIMSWSRKFFAACHLVASCWSTTN